jgi:hypothetical protein
MEEKYKYIEYIDPYILDLVDIYLDAQIPQTIQELHNVWKQEEELYPDDELLKDKDKYYPHSIYSFDRDDSSSTFTDEQINHILQVTSTRS